MLLSRLLTISSRRAPIDWGFWKYFFQTLVASFTISVSGRRTFLRRPSNSCQVRLLASPVCSIYQILLIKAPNARGAFMRLSARDRNT